MIREFWGRIALRLASNNHQSSMRATHILLMRKISNRHKLTAIVGNLAALSFLQRVRLRYLVSSRDRPYNGPDTRADALFVGGALPVTPAFYAVPQRNSGLGRAIQSRARD